MIIRRKMPSIPKRSAPSMRVMATYTDRELLDSLLDLVDEMPNDGEWDFDLEGKNEYEQITVDRLTLREALRRLAEDDQD